MSFTLTNLPIYSNFYKFEHRQLRMYHQYLLIIEFFLVFLFAIGFSGVHCRTTVPGRLIEILNQNKILVSISSLSKYEVYASQPKFCCLSIYLITEASISCNESNSECKQNICEINGNATGSRICKCNSGFMLAQDNKSCIGKNVFKTLVLAHLVF